MHYYLIEHVSHPSLEMIKPIEVSIERSNGHIIFYLNIGTEELVRMGEGENFGQAKNQFYETLSWVLNAFSENPSYSRSKEFGELYKYYKVHFKKKKRPPKSKKKPLTGVV